MKRLSVLAMAVVLTAAAAFSAIVVTGAQADTEICEKFGSTTISGGKYIVQNNNWGDDTRQCINVTSTGFSITTASHNKPQNGAPGSYPSVYAGCHYANCSTGSRLPLAVSDSLFPTIQTSVSMVYPTNASVYNASYDLWFDPTPRIDGQNTGAELMIWLHRTGSVQPVGSKVGTVNLVGATWDVWFGNIGWNVVSYVRQTPTTSISFPVSAFWSDLLTRGYGQNSWYLTSVQAGFEPWVDGTGLTVSDFSYSIAGTPTPTPAPTLTPSPTPSPTSSPTGSFTMSLQAVSPSPATVGQATNITVGFRNTASSSANNVTLKIEVFDSTGSKVAGQAWTGRNIGSQQLLSETLTWSPSASGTHVVQAGVTDSTGTTLAWNTNTGTASVNGSPNPTPSPTPSPTSTPVGSFTMSLQAVSPNPATVGQATNITVGFRNTASSSANNVTLKIEVFDSTGSKVAGQAWTGRNIGSQQLLSETLTWSPSASGTYVVQAGVTDSTGTILAWNTNTGSASVL